MEADVEDLPIVGEAIDKGDVLAISDQALIDEIDDCFPVVGTFNGPHGSCCRAAWPAKT